MSPLPLREERPSIFNATGGRDQGGSGPPRTIRLPHPATHVRNLDATVRWIGRKGAPGHGSLERSEICRSLHAHDRNRGSKARSAAADAEGEEGMKTVWLVV